MKLFDQRDGTGLIDRRHDARRVEPLEPGVDQRSAFVRRLRVRDKTARRIHSIDVVLAVHRRLVHVSQRYVDKMADGTFTWNVHQLSGLARNDEIGDDVGWLFERRWNRQRDARSKVQSSERLNRIAWKGQRVDQMRNRAARCSSGDLAQHEIVVGQSMLVDILVQFQMEDQTIGRLREDVEQPLRSVLKTSEQRVRATDRGIAVGRSVLREVETCVQICEWPDVNDAFVDHDAVDVKHASTHEAFDHELADEIHALIDVDAREERRGQERLQFGFVREEVKAGCGTAKRRLDHHGIAVRLDETDEIGWGEQTSERWHGKASLRRYFLHLNFLSIGRYLLG